MADGTVVMLDKRKVLIRLNQNGKGSGTGVQASPVADEVPPAERSDLTRADTEAERGKPVALLEGKARRETS